MIILQLGGGLGNQMFQYAMARSLQIETGEKVKIYLGHLNKDNIRSYSLKNLYCGELCNLCNSFDNLYYKALLFIRYKLVNRKLNTGENIIDLFMKRKIYYSAKNNLYLYKKFEYVPGLKIVIGGFQSHKYFSKHSDIIKSELLVKKTANYKNSRMKEEIERCNAVCVHIRKGDYKNYQELDICHERYYYQAMDYIKNHVEDPVFYIFSYDSDSIAWIKKSYNFKYTVRYVDLDNPDYEELRLMYSCKHFIISNSTFSWWAQYLCNNSKKIVVAPNKWNLEIDPSDIYMEEWKLIEV